MMASASTVSRRYASSTAVAVKVRRDLPGVIWLVVWELLASDDGTEPEPLDVDRQMVYQPGAGPPRGQYEAPQVQLGKALQDAEHVIALIGEA